MNLVKQIKLNVNRLGYKSIPIVVINAVYSIKTVENDIFPEFSKTIEIVDFKVFNVDKLETLINEVISTYPQYNVDKATKLVKSHLMDIVKDSILGVK